MPFGAGLPEFLPKTPVLTDARTCNFSSSVRLSAPHAIVSMLRVFRAGRASPDSPSVASDQILERLLNLLFRVPPGPRAPCPAPLPDFHPCCAVRVRSSVCSMGLQKASASRLKSSVPRCWKVAAESSVYFAPRISWLSARRPRSGGGVVRSGDDLGGDPDVASSGGSPRLERRHSLPRSPLGWQPSSMESTSAVSLGCAVRYAA